MPKVREERTGWRDEGLSERHRMWGWDCPAIDIDFLLVEYDNGYPCALVEYKNQHADLKKMSQKSVKALQILANRASIPFFICRYSDNYSYWIPIPKNAHAEFYLKEQKLMTEAEWVQLLYRIRGKDLTIEAIKRAIEKNELEKERRDIFKDF